MVDILFYEYNIWEKNVFLKRVGRIYSDAWGKLGQSGLLDPNRQHFEICTTKIY